MLALFGVKGPHIKKALDEHSSLLESGNIITREDFLDEEDYRHFYSAVDALWLGYHHHYGIASTSLHAAEARKPVIACKSGCIGWMTEKYKLGATFNTTLDEMHGALSWFFKQNDWKPDEEGVQALLAHHTVENFRTHLTAAFRQRHAKFLTHSQSSVQ